MSPRTRLPLGVLVSAVQAQSRAYTG